MPKTVKQMGRYNVAASTMAMVLLIHKTEVDIVGTPVNNTRSFAALIRLAKYLRIPPSRLVRRTGCTAQQLDGWASSRIAFPAMPVRERIKRVIHDEFIIRTRSAEKTWLDATPDRSSILRQHHAR